MSSFTVRRRDRVTRATAWAVVALAAACAPLGAQREGGDRTREADGRGRWAAEVWLAGAYDSNILNRAGAPGAWGVEPGLSVGFQPSPGFALEYEAQGHVWTETDRWDRLSQALRAEWDARGRGRWNAAVLAEAATQVVTAEYLQADQLTVRPMVEFRASDDDRLRLYAAYRRRRYHDEDHTGADNGYLWLQYRRRLAPYHFGYLSVRREENRARLERRDLGRTTAYAQYSGRVSPADRLNARLEYRDERYGSRTDLVDGVAVRRHERRWIPSLGWTHEIGRAALEVDYRYQTRASTVPERDFAEHLAAVTLRYRF